ncbi:MAG TPA: polysaccharide deacetylase family protein [Armatimonadota bacterium]|jgi:peptidoglycan/xylan/chitin deacetylase (PgdA/CDA1 family)
MKRVLALTILLLAVLLVRMNWTPDQPDQSLSTPIAEDGVMGAVEDTASPQAAREDPFWAQAVKEVYKSPEELLAQDVREQGKGLRYKKMLRGNPLIHTVALTFDDGPHPLYTPQLLDILDRYQVKATFFVVGKMAERYPDLIRAEVAGGHQIGNHTYHHINLTKIPRAQVHAEWLACNDVVQAIQGSAMRFCRPPGGDYNATVINAAMTSGLTTVLWTDDPGDYAQPGDAIIEARVYRQISNGGIILLHDGEMQTIQVLPRILERLQKEGFAFETVETMAQVARAH